MKKLLYTIGYEGASLPDFVGTLTAAGVSRLVDVRQLPQSRRPGFSKNALKLALEHQGITYEHRKQLGDPKPGRDAARSGNLPLFRSIFTEHMCLPASQDELKSLAATAATETCVLLCYERNPQECHRKLLCDGLEALGSFKIQHLGVQPTLAGGATKNESDRHAGAC
jgi:uncharacterized protein (DUF488 family)